MRVNTNAYNEFNQASLKELRLVVKLGFPTPYYIASHGDIPNIPAGTLASSLVNTSSISQRFVPEEGRAEIGSMSFGAVDVGGAVTTEVRAQAAAGNGLTGITVELYRGGRGMDWADFRLEQTQQIDRDVVLNKAAYRFQCRDVQRAMRKDVFDQARTKLAAQADKGAATIEVFDTSGFVLCDHPTSFGDGPSSAYIYGKIKYSNGFEIFRATGKTATQFTGVTRGLFGTADVTHLLEAGSTADAGVEIEEYIYLELPAPAAAYALLTGVIINSAGLPTGGFIPPGWSLGISTSIVDLPSFENIGDDWFDSSDYTKGLIFRFQELKKTDGKRFIEKEICLLAGAFMRIGADGKIYFRRMTGVIQSADHVHTLTPSNSIRQGPIKHELSKVRNNLDVSWSYVHFPGESEARFIRRNVLIDATSIALHGEAVPFPLKFQGLHNERHTFTTLINRFDALRDRFSGPPITMTALLMPSMNDLEVGDIVRVNYPLIEDFSNTGKLDRAFEIQRMSVDQKTGRVTCQLFGSTSKAEPISDTGAGLNSELPDSWYSSEGTELSTQVTIVSDAMTASGSLTGGTTTRTIFYFLGDLTINSGVTLTITGNVELRVRGHLQINGTIRATGGMASNTQGYLGTTFGGSIYVIKTGGNLTWPPGLIPGLNNAVPVIEIENNAGTLIGVPADMRGTGGAIGGSLFELVGTTFFERQVGGAGGAGGGSVVTVSRGVGYGVSGETDTSGTDGSLGIEWLAFLPELYSSSGGGGAPGGLVHLLDGSAVAFPILAGNLRAEYGTSPIAFSDNRTVGKAAAADTIDLGVAAGRVAYIPKSRDPYPDYENPNIGPQDGSAGSSAMNVGRRMNALDQWFDTGGTALTTPWTIETVTGPVHTTALQIIDNDDFSENIFSEVMTIDRTKKHRVSVWAKQPSGDRKNYLLVAFLDSSGANIPGSGATAANWTGYGSYYYWEKVGAAFASTYTNYTFDFGGDAGAEIPAAAASMKIGGLFTRDGPVGTETTVELQDYFAVELADDGADGAAGTDGTDGTDGGDGDSVHVSIIYLRSASAPSTPTADDGSYNFTSKTLTPPTGGWTEALPAFDANPLYSSKGTFSINGVSGTDSTVVWSAPVKIDDGNVTIGDIADFAVSDSGFTLNQEAEFRLLSSASGGHIQKRVGLGSWTTVHTWIGNGAGADYEYKVHIEGDAKTSGSAEDTWIIGSSSASYSWINTTSLGSKIAIATVQFRDANTNAILGTIAIDVSAVDI